MTALQDQLDEITANTRQLVQAERLAVGERAVARALRLRHRRPHPPRRRHRPRVRPQRRYRPPGPLAPTCSPSARWSSSSFAAAGAPTASPSWRPGATSTATLRERGALMVAIGPQTERQSDFMAGQHGLPFPVLSDPGCALAEKFGLAYTVPEYHRDYYLSILVNIPFVNGEPSWRLPLPATYVIARDRPRPLRRSPRRLPRPPRARRSPRRRPGRRRPVAALPGKPPSPPRKSAQNCIPT